LTADGGGEAIAIYDEHKAEIAVVLTDMMMPGMDGFAIIEQLRALNPAVEIIATSGLAATEMVARANRLGVLHFLQKPYTTESLLRTLSELREGRAKSTI